MRRAHLDGLQWFGLLAAPLAWATQLVLGTYLAEAHCEVSHWGNGWSKAELALTAGAAAVVLAAEAAAATVYLELRRTHADAPGPPGRQHLFAVGGLVGNVLFLVAILLSGLTVVSTTACRPA
jgi:hypothetical protein